MPQWHNSSVLIARDNSACTCLPSPPKTMRATEAKAGAEGQPWGLQTTEPKQNSQVRLKGFPKTPRAPRWGGSSEESRWPSNGNTPAPSFFPHSSAYGCQTQPAPGAVVGSASALPQATCFSCPCCTGLKTIYLRGGRRMSGQGWHSPFWDLPTRDASAHFQPTTAHTRPKMVSAPERDSSKVTTWGYLLAVTSPGTCCPSAIPYYHKLCQAAWPPSILVLPFDLRGDMKISLKTPSLCCQSASTPEFI